jgi:hypothetical protein
MANVPQPRVPWSQLAYLLVFGIFVFVYLARVLNGTATTADWVILGVAAFLLIITAYRVLISLGKPPK